MSEESYTLYRQPDYPHPALLAQQEYFLRHPSKSSPSTLIFPKMPVNSQVNETTTAVSINGPSSQNRVDRDTLGATLEGNSRPNLTGVPSLDLTGLRLEDDDEGEESSRQHVSIPGNIEALKDSFNVPGNKGEQQPALFVKKKPSFVFPLEKPLEDFDVCRSDEPGVASHHRGGALGLYMATSNSAREHTTASSQKTVSRTGNQTTSIVDKDGTLHFSLSNPKLGKYLMADEIAPRKLVVKKDSPKSPGKEQNAAKKEIVGILSPKNSVSEKGDSGAATKCHALGMSKAGIVNVSSSGVSDTQQEVIDVVVVDGHLSQPYVEMAAFQINGDAPDTMRLELAPEDMDDQSRDKQKPRVTFSLENDFFSHRSLKRYSPVKPSVQAPLQGVLKRRPEPVQVLSDDCLPRSSRYDYFKDDNAAFRPTIVREASKPAPTHFPDGIPVKHLHSTTSDLVGRKNHPQEEKPPLPPGHARSATMSPSEGPPAVHRRIQLPYTSTSHGGPRRINYYRSGDAVSVRSAEDFRTRSKSVEDVNKRDMMNGLPKGPGHRSRSNLPFTLRRCASSDHSLVSGSSGHSHRPRVAFGSFILPKEATPRLKQAQLKFHESAADPQRGYVHSHSSNRRSPYALPAQILYRDASPGKGRRPCTAYHKQQPSPPPPPKQLNSQYVRVPNQRHSAPASYGSSREPGWRAAARARLSVETSPSRHPRDTKPPALPVHARVNGPSKELSLHLNGRPRPSAAKHDIAAMSKTSVQTKGLSQHRFLATLPDSFGQTT